MRTKRQAFTLLEIVLTMTVLVIVVAIVTPSVSTMYAQHKVRAGTDTIRAGWVNARTHAVDEARRYRFSVVLGKSNFRIAPDDPAFWSGSAPDIDEEHPAMVMEDALPQGIRFTMDNAAVDNHGDSVQQGVSSSQWTTIAIFESDGTAQDNKEITLTLPGARPMVVKLRAATGGSTVEYGEVAK